MKIRLIGIAGLLAAGLAACSTLYNPATGQKETLLTTPIEVAIGNIAKTQMGLFSLQMGKVEPQQFAKVQAIGQRLAQVSDRKDVQYQFGVVQDKSLNAFALPGGTIYVHTGLIEKAEEDELAAVLAHEIGHVAARHAAKHLQADLGVAVLLQIASSAGGTGAGGAVQIANSMYGLFRNGYSRRDELEADRIGIRYAFRAGYNPEAMVTFFQKLLQEHPEDEMAKAMVWQRTHPLTSDRIAQAKKEVASLRNAKFCPVCGRKYEAEVKFCEKDGTLLKQVSIPKMNAKMERFCPVCGAVYSPRTKFCEKDGTLLKEREIKE